MGRYEITPVWANHHLDNLDEVAFHYIIKCDETNNTPITIDRNELHVAIAVKPVKTVEYIIVNFIVTNQSTNVMEEIRRI
jgi:hypothetical protein